MAESVIRPQPPAARNRRQKQQADMFTADANFTGSTETPDVDSRNTPLSAAVHPRNTLNDLSGAEWLPETKSFFFQKGLGSKHPHAQIERQHPAPFSFQDVQ